MRIRRSWLAPALVLAMARELGRIKALYRR